MLLSARRVILRMCLFSVVHILLPTDFLAVKRTTHRDTAMDMGIPTEMVHVIIAMATTAMVKEMGMLDMDILIPTAMAHVIIAVTKTTKRTHRIQKSVSVFRD